MSKLTAEEKQEFIGQIKARLTAGARIFIETGYSSKQSVLISVYHNGFKLASYHQFTNSISQILQRLFGLNILLEDTDIITCKGGNCYFIHYQQKAKKGAKKDE